MKPVQKAKILITALMTVTFLMVFHTSSWAQNNNNNNNASNSGSGNCLPGLPCTDVPAPVIVLEDQFDTIHPNESHPTNHLTNDLACDAGFMNQIYSVAHLHAEREFMTLENQLRKPDSVLEYSCFHQDIVLMAEWLPWNFSETPLFSYDETSDVGENGADGDGTSTPGDGERFMKYSSVCLEPDTINAWDGSGNESEEVGAQGVAEGNPPLSFTRASGHPIESPQCSVNDPVFYQQDNQTLFPDYPALYFHEGPLNWRRYHGNNNNGNPTENDAPHTPRCRVTGDPGGVLPFENNRFAQIHNCDVPPLGIDVNMRTYYDNNGNLTYIPDETSHFANELERLVWRGLVDYIGMNTGNANFGHDFLGGYTNPGHIGGIGPVPLGAMDIDSINNPFNLGGAELCPTVNNDGSLEFNGCDEAADDPTSMNPADYENLMPDLAPAPDARQLLTRVSTFAPIMNARLTVPSTPINIPGLPGGDSISGNPLFFRNGTSASSFTCDFMNRVWEWTRCDNAYTFEFFSFSTLENTDVRIFPTQCNANNSSGAHSRSNSTPQRHTPSIAELLRLADNNLTTTISSASIYDDLNYISNSALSVGLPAIGIHQPSTASIDSINANIGIYDESSCGEPIPSGIMSTFLSYALDVNGNANVRSLTTPAYTCVPPGCFYDGRNCVRCTQTGGGECALN